MNTKKGNAWLYALATIFLLLLAACGQQTPGKSFKIAVTPVPNDPRVSHSETFYGTTTQGQTNKGKEQDWDVKVTVSVPNLTCNPTRKSQYGIGVFLNLAPATTSGLPLMQAVFNNLYCKEWEIGYELFQAGKQQQVAEVYNNLGLSQGDQVTMELVYSKDQHQYTVTLTYPGGTLPTQTVKVKPSEYPVTVQWGMEAPLLPGGFALLPKFDPPITLQGITINGESLQDYGGTLTHSSTALIKDSPDFQNSQVTFTWIKEK